MQKTAGNKKCVLVLTSTFPRWQGDKEPPFVFELCRRLGKQFDVLVLAPHAKGAECFEKMDGLEVMRFRYFFSGWERLAYQGGILANLKRSRWCYLLLPFYFLLQMVALWRILRQRHIDLIHAHWLIPQGLTVAILGIFTRKMPPVLCTSHGGDLLGLDGMLLTLVKSWVIRRASWITVVSHAMKERAMELGSPPGRLRVIPMGVDIKTLFTADIATCRADSEILFVGRLVEKKGCSYLLDAMPSVLLKYPKAHLGIVGSGPEEEVLKQQARRLGITHAVTFHGALSNDDIPVLYRRAAVFVAPYIVTSQGDQEGLGLTLVEALACGCSVVATDFPAVRDVIIDDVSGLICRQKCSVDLAAKVCMLLDHPGLREKMGRAGREHVQSFDWAAISRRYIALIDELVQERL